MKKKYLLMAIVAMLFSACDNDSDIDVKPDHLQNGVGVHVDEFIFEGGSRTKIDQDGAITWTAGDALGICPRYGTSNVRFCVMPETVSDDESATYAFFDGGDWALRKNSSYAAYYPYQHILDFDASHINVSLIDQQQRTSNTGVDNVSDVNECLAHLGAYDFMASVYTQTGDEDAVGEAFCEFEMKHLCAIARFAVQVDRKVQLNHLTVKRSDGGAFITDAYYSLGDVDAQLRTDVPPTNPTLELGLSEIVSSGATHYVSLYMMVAPQDFTSTNLDITLTGIDMSDDFSTRGHTVIYTGSVAGKNMEAGHGYLYKYVSPAVETVSPTPNP